MQKTRLWFHRLHIFSSCLGTRRASSLIILFMGLFMGLFMRLFVGQMMGSLIWQNSAHASPPKLRIVIDPGHGGGDEGTVYDAGLYRISEKDVTLKLSQLIKENLRKEGFDVTLTRETDHELSLTARTAIANRLKADLFVSIHMNSSQGLLEANAARAEGIETYILNNTSDASSKRLAHLENAVLTAETPYSPEEMDVALILKDLRLDGNLTESKRLACHIQEKLVATTSKISNQKKRNRGVKQALFHVLLGADMPSVLVEAGFLSHPNDRSLVLSPAGQAKLGKSISDAIHEFSLEKKFSSSQSSKFLNSCRIN